MEVNKQVPHKNLNCKDKMYYLIERNNINKIHDNKILKRKFRNFNAKTKQMPHTYKNCVIVRSYILRIN